MPNSDCSNLSLRANRETLYRIYLYSIKNGLIPNNTKIMNIHCHDDLSSYFYRGLWLSKELDSFGLRSTSLYQYVSIICK